jgi:tape measure domain-containing protein
MAEKLEFDVSGALAGIKSLRSELDGLEADTKDVTAASKNLFSGTDQVVNVTDDIKNLRSEYGKLQESAAILKKALANAYDERAIKEYAQRLGEAQKGMALLEDTAGAVGVSLKGANKEAGLGKQVFSEYFGAFTKATLIVAAITAVVSFTKAAVNLADETKKARLSFEAFTGSAEKTDKLLKELSKTGQKKFINTQNMQEAAKSLLGAEFAANKIPGTLAKIADISAATGKDFNELATIFAKAKTQGTLFAEDINQLLDAGVPIIGEFSKQLGVSGDQVKKLASEGKISFAELELAFANLTKEGGKFAGQAEVSANTVGGAWKKLTAAIEPEVKAVGGFFSNIFQKALEGATGTYLAIKNLFVDNPIPSDLEDLAALERDRSEYESTLNEFLEIEQRARDERNKKSKEQREKEQREAEQRIAQQFQNQELLLSLQEDGIEKELALENLRFDRIRQELKKNKIATKQNIEEVEAARLRALTEVLVNSVEKEVEEIDKANQKRIEADAKAVADRETAAQKSLQISKERATLEIDFFEQQGKKYINTLRERGVSEQEIADVAARFDFAAKKKRLESEIAFQEALLELIDAGDTEQIALAKQRIETLKATLDAVVLETPKDKGGKGGGLLGLIGIEPGSDDEEALKAFVDQAKTAISEITAARVQAAAEEVRIAEERIRNIENILQREEDLEKQGFANNADLRRQELEAAKKDRDKALEDQRKAQRVQILADSAVQASSLITATANFFKSNSNLGPIGIGLAIASIAAMFGLFAKSKIDALKATSVKARTGARGMVGDDGVIVGPSHGEGGVGLEVEGGEFMRSDGKQFAVVRREMTAKHFDLLQAINEDNRPSMARHLQDILAAPSLDMNSAKRIEGAYSGAIAVKDQKMVDLMQQNNALLKENNRLISEAEQYVSLQDGYIVLKNGKVIKRVRNGQG